MVYFSPNALILALAAISHPTAEAWTSTLTRSVRSSISRTQLNALQLPQTDSVTTAAQAKLSPILTPLSGASTKITETEATIAKMKSDVMASGAKTALSASDAINDFFSTLTSNTISAIPMEQVESIAGDALSAAREVASSLDESLLSSPALSPIYEMIKMKLSAVSPLLGDKFSNLPPVVGIIASAAVTYALSTAVLNFGKPPPPGRPYPLNKYDAQSAREYFDGRLNEVLGRAIQVGSMSASFGLSLFLDYMGDKLEENAEIRAEELSILLTKLGPSFIKIGQSLSIRTDLLSPAYVRGLKTLQDQVPAFPTSEARVVIEDELGQSVDSIFSEFSSKPVAAASLGQVYRAKLRSNGQEVAVKVQRPDIMNQIALDMHLIREVAPVLKRTFNLNTDLVGTVDAWGIGFVDELDYIAEADNAKRFTESMQTTPLAGVVFSPPVVDEYTSGKVLTTEWVDGERLDKSSKDDVTILCSIAMNTYLTMMLETGVLHCDPHPGNLFRTGDGKLCILDWGMVTRLDPDLQLTLIEHMAHLTSADYAEIPRDLLLLGFIPEEKASEISDSGVVETLADIYGAWSGGGGAAAINVNKVVAQLQDLTAEKGNLFQIPPYFAYIAKSFSVLEGIGLSNDPKYSIINECLPYVSKRLLTDKSERTGGALSTFIFGPKKSDTDRIVDYDRVEQLVTGFGNYTTSASGALLGKGMSSRMQMIEDAADQILDLLVTEEETPLQGIFLEQIAKIVSSSSRSVWARIRERSGTLPSGRTVLGTIVDPLGLWRTSPIIMMNELDEKTIRTTRNLFQLIQDQIRASENPAFDISTLSNEELVELSSIIVRKVWSRRSGVLVTANRLANELIKLTADKLERGERDVLVIPRVEASQSDDGPLDRSANDGRIHDRTKPKPTSSRLAGARALLEDLERSGNISRATPAGTPAMKKDKVEKEKKTQNPEGAQQSTEGNRLDGAKVLLSDVEKHKDVPDVLPQVAKPLSEASKTAVTRELETQV